MVQAPSRLGDISILGKGDVSTLAAHINNYKWKITDLSALTEDKY
jgi:hypothetical protein